MAGDDGGFDLSIIILGYNGERVLSSCLDSIRDQTYPLSQCEVIYADNASHDGSLSLAKRHLRDFPSARTIGFETNLGYARGNNSAAAEAEGDVLLFLNQDLVLDSRFVIEILRSLERAQDVAIAGGTLRSARNGRLITGGVRVLPGGFAYNYIRGPGPCDAVSGAAIAVRRTVFERLGGFDESLFMYYEETDLCLRAWEAGFGVVHNPQAIAFDLTPSRARRTSDPFLFHMLRNRPIFYAMHSHNGRKALLLDRLFFFPANLLLEILRNPAILAKADLVAKARGESLVACRELVAPGPDP